MENKLEKKNYEDDAFGLMNPFFRGFFNDPFYSDKKSHQVMKTDVKEGEKNYELAVEVPGFNKDQISLSLDDGYLTISAHENKNNDVKDNNGKYIRKERFSGSYERSFYVGDIKEDEIDAQLNNGVLTITLPKEDARDNSKKMIQIK